MSQLQKGVWTCVAIACMAAAFGCGGDRLSRRKSNIAADDSGAAAGAEAEKARLAAAMQQANTPPQPAAKGVGAGTAGGNVLQKAASAVQAAADVIAPENPWDVPLTLPSDLSLWTPEHLRGARIVGDRRLGEALIAYARAHRDDPQAAETVAAMLADAATLNQSGYGERVPIPPPPPPPPGQEPIPQTRVIGRMPELVPPMIEALAVIGTDRAIQTFTKLLSGYQKTDENEKFTASYVTASLARVGGEEYERLLIQCLTQPEQFRAAEHDSVIRGDSETSITADTIQGVAAESTWNNENEGLRTKLANALPSASITQMQRRRIFNVLLTRRLDNMGAMSVLYNSGELSGKELESTLLRLTLSSSESIQTMLDLPPAERALVNYDTRADSYLSEIEERKTSSFQKISPKEKARRTAAVLWQDKFIIGLEKQLSSMVELDQTTELIQILQTIPTNRTRATALQFWERFYSQGKAAIGTPNMALDPGLLPLVKLIEHDTYNFAIGKMEPRAYNPPSLAAAQNSERRVPPQVLQQMIRVDWTYGLESLMKTWMRRCSAAATAQQDGGGVDNASAGDWEIALPKGNQKKLEFTVFLGPHLGSQLISPTRIRFRRFEMQTGPDELHIFFTKNLKGAVSRPVEEGRWLDFAEVRESDRLIRSVDILLRSKTFEQSPPPRRAKERLVFDVLQVEIEDPRTSAAGT